MSVGVYRRRFDYSPRARRRLVRRRALGVAAAAVPVNSVAPSITFGGFVGREQEIDVGTWTNTPTSYAYQWGRADNGSGLNAADITGETASTYTFQSDDQEKYIYCDIIATNGAGSSTETRSNYQLCYTRVALPTATTLERTLDSLAAYDGKELFTETINDTSEAVDDPVTWKNEAPQNTKDFSFFTVAVDSGTGVRFNDSGCTKISENWGVVANHAPGNGDAYYFMDAGGDEHVVGYDILVRIGDTGPGDHDLALIHFDTPIDDADVPPVNLPTAGLYNSLGGEYCLAIERGRHLNRLLLDAGNTSSDPDTLWAATTADVLEGGDSGKPVFLFVDGEPVLAATAVYTTLTGPNPAHWLREIQDVLATTGDALTLVQYVGSGGGFGIRSAIRCAIGHSTEENR